MKDSHSVDSVCRHALLFVLVVGFAMTFAIPLQAQNSGRDLWDRYRAQNEIRAIHLLRRFIAIPNVTADRNDVRENAEFLLREFSARGADMEWLEVPGGNPVVYGELAAPRADRTIVIYAHFDGQPVNRARWQTTEPFKPALYSQSAEHGGRPIAWPESGESVDPEWRIYGRSASDDKAPFIALLMALDALKEHDVPLTSNIKFFFDGEEEIGSPNMQRVLGMHRNKFAEADLWIFCDGPMHQSRQPTLYYGVRGITSMELTVYGATRNLHSGHYGNWAPNAAMRLVELLATMKGPDDRVLIDGFYESVQPLSESEQQAIDRVPSVDESLRKELGLKETEAGNQPYLQRLQLPSLNIRGLQSANVGTNARNIVPRSATASIDIRLVKGNHPEKMLRKVEQHIERQGYLIVREEPTADQRRQHGKIARVTRDVGYPAARTSMDHPQVQPLVRALTEMLDEDQSLLQIPGLGGSLPLYLITEAEDKPLVILPLANHDNNQHAPDENLRLGNLWYGFDAMVALLTMDGDE